MPRLLSKGPLIEGQQLNLMVNLIGICCSGIASLWLFSPPYILYHLFSVCQEISLPPAKITFMQVIGLSELFSWAYYWFQFMVIEYFRWYLWSDCIEICKLNQLILIDFTLFSFL